MVTVVPIRVLYRAKIFSESNHIVRRVGLIHQVLQLYCWFLEAFFTFFMFTGKRRSLLKRRITFTPARLQITLQL